MQWSGDATDDPYRLTFRRDEPVAFLPHSCDEWIIGDADNVRALIADLQTLLARVGA